MITKTAEKNYLISVPYKKKNAEEATEKEGAVTNQCNELKEKGLNTAEEYQNKRKGFLKNL